MDRLEELGHLYDALTLKRRRWVNEYDAAPDGSRRKATAVRHLAMVSKQIREVEDEIGEIVEDMDEEEE